VLFISAGEQFTEQLLPENWKFVIATEEFIPHIFFKKNASKLEPGNWDKSIQPY